MKNLFSSMIIAAMVLACIVGTSTKADAAFIAYICSTANCSAGIDLRIADGGLLDGAPSLAGAIVGVAAAFPGSSFVVNISQSKPLLGSSPTQPRMDLNFTATGHGHVWLYATDTDFYGGPLLGTIAVGGTANGGTINVGAWWDSGNGERVLTTKIASLGPFGGSTPGEFSGKSDPEWMGQADAYSLTLFAEINREHQNGETTTGNLTFNPSNPVPEPGSMMLLGTGLIGLAGAVRHRMKKQK